MKALIMCTFAIPTLLLSVVRLQKLATPIDGQVLCTGNLLTDSPALPFWSKPPLGNSLYVSAFSLAVSKVSD